MDETVEGVERFRRYFTAMKLDDLSPLDEIHAEDILFKDPLHEITGIDNLKRYFGRLNSNLVSGSFEFESGSVSAGQVFLPWQMRVSLKSPRKEIQVSGISVLAVDRKIVSHRDYFDAGELIYEHVPLLGGFIRLVKRKLVQEGSRSA